MATTNNKKASNCNCPEYMVLKPGNDAKKGIMKIDKVLGPVFIDREAKDKMFKGYGLYKTKFAGVDKKDKPFVIVVPVFEFTEETDDIRFWMQHLIRSNDEDHRTSVAVTNYNRRFNVRTGRTMAAKVSITNVMDFIKVQSLDILHDIISRPLGKPDSDKFIVSIAENETSITTKWDGNVLIAYLSGETEVVSANWVVQHRDRMIDATAKVVGDTIDNLSVIFTRDIA